MIQLKLNFAALVLTFALAISSANATPLDDYVNEPDPHYNYYLLKTYVMTGYRLFILNMTSQKWLDETYVTNPIWWHYLCVTVPDKVTRPDASFILIDGGANTDA
jgi:PhoPQ-activated pathogenicity-related protein